MASSSFFEQHPKLTLVSFFAVLILCLAGAAEIALRFIIPYDIGYYTGVRKQGEYDYPYGKIFINSTGFPDEEFNLQSTKPRIGYFGDSVTYGVGAGAGYRFSDLLEKEYPAYEHWTFSMIGDGIQDLRIVKTVEKYNLDAVIYAMNLNDILPVFDDKKKSGTDADEKQGEAIFIMRNWIYQSLDILRGKSYLYTWLRTEIKNALTRLGYGHTGFKSAELFPRENEPLIQDVAVRINDLSQALAKKGVPFCIIILPYEMQISKDAAQIYASLGIRWGEGFLEGSTQSLLRKNLVEGHIYDGLDAFKGRQNDPVGSYFVYNKGDKIDFNHPNRAGHARLAEGFAQSRACPVLSH